MIRKQLLSDWVSTGRMYILSRVCCKKSILIQCRYQSTLNSKRNICFGLRIGVSTTTLYCTAQTSQQLSSPLLCTVGNVFERRAIFIRASFLFYRPPLYSTHDRIHPIFATPLACRYFIRIKISSLYRVTRIHSLNNGTI